MNLFKKLFGRNQLIEKRNPPKEELKLSSHNSNTLLDNNFIGLIDEKGVATVSFDDECYMIFSFCAYIKGNQPLVNKDITISKNAPNIDYLEKGLEPLTIVEIKGNHIDDNRINLTSIIKTNCFNKELLNIRQRRLDPITYKSDFLGTLTLDKTIDSLIGEMRWENNSIKILLVGDINELQKLESNALELFEKQNEWNSKFNDKIIQDLLSLKNENWLRENESPLNKVQFREKISLESLTFYKNGDFEASYDDDDIFWGHSIHLIGNLDKGLKEASIID